MPLHKVSITKVFIGPMKTRSTALGGGSFWDQIKELNKFFNEVFNNNYLKWILSKLWNYGIHFIWLFFWACILRFSLELAFVKLAHLHYRYLQ